MFTCGQFVMLFLFHFVIYAWSIRVVNTPNGPSAKFLVENSKYSCK